VQRPPLAGDVLARGARELRQVAGALDHGTAGMHGEPSGARDQRGARLAAVQRHRGLGGVGRRRAARRGDVVDQRAVGVMADRRDDRHAQERHRAAQRLVAEGEEVGHRSPAAGHDHDLDLPDSGQVLQSARDGRGGVTVLHGGEGPHHASLPAAAAQAGEHVVARLAAFAGHHADAARQRGPRQALLRLEQPFRRERAAQDLDLGEQVALARETKAADGERERRRGGARPRVVVRPADDDDLSSVGQRPGREAQLLEGVAPHRARHGALGVAQLEPHASAPDA
jgi:hypothetical protein